MGGRRRRPKPGGRATSIPLVRDSFQAETLAAEKTWKQRLRENLEAEIAEAPHFDMPIAAAMDLLEKEFSKWMANQEEDATKKDEMNPWKDEADPSDPSGGLKHRKQDDACFSSIPDEPPEEDLSLIHI